MTETSNENGRYPISEQTQLISQKTFDHDLEGDIDEAAPFETRRDDCIRRWNGCFERCNGWFEEFRLYNNAPIEATGCAIDAYARSSIFMVTFFVGPVLLRLAKQQAIELNGCFTEDDNYDNCVAAARIYGFKPSSLLTNMKSVASLTSLVLLPLFGAVVDFTPYRKQVGMVTALGLVLVQIFELKLGPSTWFFVVCMRVLSDILYQFHTATTESYSAEITNKTMSQSKYQSSFAAIIFLAMFLYVLTVNLSSFILHHRDEVSAARFSIVVSIIHSGPLLALGWIYCFRDRPPASKLPEDQMILMAGFRKLSVTYEAISSEHETIRHFLMHGVAWSEAAVTSLPLIAITYMTDYLELDSQEIGLTLLTTMVGGMPGAFAGHFFSKLYQNPVRSAQLSLLTFTINTLLASVFLHPDTKYFIYGFAFVWGICEGWMRPQNSTIFVTIAPMQNGALELMALFIFFRNILTFIPPMLFSILNEVGIPMWVGFSSLGLYSTVGLIGLTTMGDYEEARSLVLNERAAF